MSVQPEVLGKVYSCVEQHCPEFEFSEPWQRVEVCSAFRMWSPDLLTELQQKLSESELLDAGILVREGQDGLVLAPPLQKEDAVVPPLRKPGRALPDQLLVEDAVLPPGSAQRRAPTGSGR